MFNTIQLIITLIVTVIVWIALDRMDVNYRKEVKRNREEAQEAKNREFEVWYQENVLANANN